jgi:hypothetical protein
MVDEERKVRITYDVEKDMKNIWRVCNSPVSYGVDVSDKVPKELIEASKGEYPDCRNRLLALSTQMYPSVKNLPFILGLQSKWEEIEAPFFTKLWRITKRPHKGDITGYLTNAVRCPYDPRDGSFMVSLRSPIQRALLTCGHEILHLHFHQHYFNKVAEKVGEEKAHDIKEALTVLLNLEFADLMKAEDKGYKKHERMRKFIEARWKEEKNFQKLLEGLVNF